MHYRNKNKVIIVFFIFMPYLFFNCSTKLCLQKRTDRLIEKSLKKTDIIYLYSVAFNDFNLVWYHKGNFIYSFWVKPYKTKHYKPVEAKNIIVNNDSIQKYFDGSLYKDIQCFEHTLDGEWIELYVKGKNRIMSSIDLKCLFNTKFEANSFPYKLQYDFSIIHKLIDFNFEEMYNNESN